MSRVTADLMVERAVSSVGRASRLHRRTSHQITPFPSLDGRTERDSMANKAQLADQTRTITRRSRSAWFMPKPKPLGPDIPYAMDDAYWAALVPDGDVVYFLGVSQYYGDGTIELVKIGHSRNLGNRLNQLCGNMGMMRGELLVSVIGGVDRERAYHNRFAEHRQSGEWFRPDYAILAEVARLKRLEA